MESNEDRMTAMVPTANKPLVDHNLDPSTASDDVREHLISTAVKFLQNPRVRPTSLAQKQVFLKRKGLTDVEVDHACERAGAFSDDENNNIKVVGPKVPLDPRAVYPISTRTSLLLKAMDVANMIALFSIGSYSLYSLWKNYIAPRIYGTRSRLEQNYERLLESITSLNQNVVELRELVRESQLQSASRVQQSLEFQEVRKEITSIKSILLGRSNFPSPSSSQVGIPSWQMVEAGDNSNENSDESSSRSKRPNKKDKSASSSRSRETLQGAGTSSSGGVGGGDTLTLTDPDIDEDHEGVPQSSSMRKHPSLDSNNGFTSGSSCEVVFLGKNPDSSDPDHSE